MPAVREAVARQFGSTRLVAVTDDQAVCLGAALHAASFEPPSSRRAV
jgi:molecular chaperone DnaK (HSP70)